nr:pentatricopeptide repeat-containing protein [Tanacetum cinerariifolium]
MKRASKGYIGVNIPLFLGMIVQGPNFQGEGSTVPVDSYHTPTGAPSTLALHLSLPPRSFIRQETEVPQPSSPTHTHVADEAASTDLEDPSKQGRKIEEIDQDPDILLIQHDADIQGSPVSPTRRVSTADDITMAETLETEVPQPSSPPHTNVTDEVASTGMDVRHEGAATTLTRLDAKQGSDRVLALKTDLKQAKKIYGAAYIKLIMKVKMLEKTVKTSQAKRKSKIVMFDKEVDLEDPSKQGRKIEEIDQDPDILLIQHDQLLLLVLTSILLVLQEEFLLLMTLLWQRHWYTSKEVQQRQKIKEEWENIRERVKADEELNQRFQAEERNKYSEVDQERIRRIFLDGYGVLVVRIAGTIDRIMFSQLLDMLVAKVKDNIWALFIFIPGLDIDSGGLKLIESDADVHALYDLAEKEHDKRKKHACNMSVEELIAWAEEEAKSPNLRFGEIDDIGVGLTPLIREHEKYMEALLRKLKGSKIGITDPFAIVEESKEKFPIYNDLKHWKLKKSKGSTVKVGVIVNPDEKTYFDRDGNNHVFPVAWDVVSVENKDNWTWFLKLIAEDLEVPNRASLTLMYDQHKGGFNDWRVFNVGRYWFNKKKKFGSSSTGHVKMRGKKTKGGRLFPAQRLGTQKSKVLGVGGMENFSLPPRNQTRTMGILQRTSSASVMGGDQPTTITSVTKSVRDGAKIRGGTNTRGTSFIPLGMKSQRILYKKVSEPAKGTGSSNKNDNVKE